MNTLCVLLCIRPDLCVPTALIHVMQTAKKRREKNTHQQNHIRQTNWSVLNWKIKCQGKMEAENLTDWIEVNIYKMICFNTLHFVDECVTCVCVSFEFSVCIQSKPICYYIPTKFFASISSTEWRMVLNRIGGENRDRDGWERKTWLLIQIALIIRLGFNHIFCLSLILSLSHTHINVRLFLFYSVHIIHQY